MEIIPNWHPIAVHFAITLVALNAAAHLFKPERPETRERLIWLQSLVTPLTLVSVLLALATGLYAFYTVDHDDLSHLAMIDHRFWAFSASAILLAGFATWHWRKHQAYTLTALFFLAALGVTSTTAFKGGELVYRHGLGVQSLPTISSDGHGHEHEHGHDHSDGEGHGSGQATTPTSTISATKSSVQTVAAFRDALRSGDEARLKQLLHDKVLILEGSGVERSLADYAAHHMQSDIAAMTSSRIEMIEQHGAQSDESAYVVTRFFRTGRVYRRWANDERNDGSEDGGRTVEDRSHSLVQLMRGLVWAISTAAALYLSIALLAPAGVAEESSVAVLSLEEARKTALAENPGLAEMQARYEALVEVAPQQSSLPDPVISLGAMNFPWDDFDRNQENMTQLQVGVSQVFPFPGKLGLREDIALFEAETALHSVEEMRLNLDMNVSLTWWELYFLDRSLDTLQRNQSLLRQFVEVARKKYEVGKGLQQDVLLAQVELSKLLDQEIQVQAVRDQREIRLNLLMGLTPDIPIALPTVTPLQNAPLADEASLYLRAEVSRPVLDAQRAQIEASKSRLELAKKDYYPDFKVGVTYGNRDENDLGQSRQDFLSVMVSMNVPLYAGTKQDKAVQQRSRELAKSQYALSDQRNLVMSTISMATTDYERASEQLTLYDQGIIPQARQTVESMLAGYQVDEVDFLNLVRSQVTLLNYELQYWRSYTEVNQSIARMKAAVGEENIYE